MSLTGANFMYRTLFFSAFLVTAALLYRSSVSGRRPAVEILPSQVDLGQVYEHQTISAQAQIRNNSSDQWRISDIQTTCHCTTTGIEIPYVLNPGEAATIPIVFASETGDGPRAQKLHVVLEKIGSPASSPVAIPLSVVCTIVPELRSEPANILFGRILEDSGKKETIRTFTLRSIIEDSIKIRRAVSSDSRVTVSGPLLVGRKGEQFTVTLDHNRIGNTTSLSGSITIEFDGEYSTSLRVPFHAVMVPKYTLIPDVIVFPSNASSTTALPLTIVGTTRFRVSRIDCPAHFTCRQDTVDDLALEHRLSVHGADITSSQSDTMLRLEVSHEGGAPVELEIPVRKVSSLPMESTDGQ